MTFALLAVAIFAYVYGLMVMRQLARPLAASSEAAAYLASTDEALTKTLRGAGHAA